MGLKAQQHDYNILTTQPNGEALTATFLLKYALGMLLLCKYVAFWALLFGKLQRAYPSAKLWGSNHNMLIPKQEARWTALPVTIFVTKKIPPNGITDTKSFEGFSQKRHFFYVISTAD